MIDGANAWYTYVELTNRYADAVDRGAGSEVAALFAPLGRWDGTAFGLAVLTGGDALTHHFTQTESELSSVHLVSNHLVVDASEMQIAAQSYGLSITSRKGRIRNVIVRYDDLVVPEGGEWRFTERVLGRSLSY
jgi:16S rRNA U516 pseudouridylate synthase RsuA-like enzyme